MAIITLRQANVVISPNATIKGSPLTNSEVDNNFANVNVELSDLGNTVANLSTSTIANGTSNVNITTADGPIEISANFLPLTANIFDLGSPTKRFRDLFLTGNSLHLGETVLSSDGSNVLINNVVTISSTGNFIGTVNVTDAIQDNSITTTKIAESAVIASKIDTNAVTEAKIATNAVTEAKIATNAVTEAKINSGAVTEAKIATNAVTEAKINTDAVTSAKVVANAITEAKIADAAVTTVKLSTTGVTAAPYGNATLIPTFTVGVDGRITAAGNVAIEASGGGGSGLFNTAIDTAVGYAVTDSMATAYTAPSTAGLRYIVHSIHITNIGDVDATISGQFSGTTYSSITFGDTVPLPPDTSVELLKKPKVLQPSDLIQLQASATSTLHATITIETAQDDTYFGSGIDITTTATYQELYTASANTVIESVLLSNDESGDLDVLATVVWTDAANVIQGYYVFDLLIPNDATVEVLEQPKFIESGYKVRVQANQPNRLEAIISGKTV